MALQGSSHDSDVPRSLLSKKWPPLVAIASGTSPTVSVSLSRLGVIKAASCFCTTDLRENIYYPRAGKISASLCKPQQSAKQRKRQATTVSCLSIIFRRGHPGQTLRRTQNQLLFSNGEIKASAKSSFGMFPRSTHPAVSWSTYRRRGKTSTLCGCA